MIGLRFKVPNEYGKYLYMILSEINIRQYKWHIITDSIIVKKYEDDKETIYDGLFSSEYLTGDDLSKLIDEYNYYMIFVDIKAFPFDTDFVSIETYSDFINSDCQMVLLCVDSEFVTFFCKDIEVLKKVKNNCYHYGFKDIELLSHIEGHNYDMIAF